MGQSHSNQWHQGLHASASTSTTKIEDSSTLYLLDEKSVVDLRSHTDAYLQKKRQTRKKKRVLTELERDAKLLKLIQTHSARGLKSSTSKKGSKWTLTIQAIAACAHALSPTTLRTLLRD